jgi:DNA-binding NtrC family response regulator
MCNLSDQRTCPSVYKEIEPVFHSSINVLLEGENGVGKDYAANLIYQKRDGNGALIIYDCERSVRDQVQIVAQLTSPDFFQKLRRSGHKDSLLIRRVDLLQAHLLAQLSDFLEMLGERGGFSRNTLLHLGIIGSVEKREGVELLNFDLLNKLLDILFCFRIEIPPLRKRKEEIPWFIDKFLSMLNLELKREVTGFAPDALGILLQYHWPNNLSELRAEIERDITLTRDNDLVKISALSNRLTKYTSQSLMLSKHDQS